MPELLRSWSAAFRQESDAGITAVLVAFGLVTALLGYFVAGALAQALMRSLTLTRTTVRPPSRNTRRP